MPSRKLIPRLLFLFFIIACSDFSTAQVKILFDASKAESAGSADWVIDADLHNIGFSNGPAVIGAGSESNAQRIPTPAQSGISGSTAETYWTGALSYWGIDCVNKGYVVETLPYNGVISYGNSSNAQDLSNYKVFIVCEPNILFTTAEKTALLSFVNHGGGLFIISDHDVSDRNNDTYDSPHIWNDLFQNNGTANTNPFGMIFDYQNFYETSSNLANLPASDSILHGPMGNVATVQWSAGTSMTISPSANPSVKAVVYRSGVSGPSGNNKVLVASARYGFGKVVAIGDSSPCDDGTGDPNDALFTGYMGDVPPNHRNLLMNCTIWLAAREPYTYVFTGNGNWSNESNWKYGVVPPPVLPAGDAILIDNQPGGQCLLDVPQHISAGASLTVKAGKKLLDPSFLLIQ